MYRLVVLTLALSGPFALAEDGNPAIPCNMLNGLNLNNDMSGSTFLGDEPVIGSALIPYPPGGNSIIDSYGTFHTCGFYAMGWNNFLYLMGNETDASDEADTKVPRFLSYAPWHYLNTGTDGAPKPFPAAGERVAVSADQVGNFLPQAGSWTLYPQASVSANPVVYDVRMNAVMYGYLYGLYADARSSDSTASFTSIVTSGDTTVGNTDLAFPPNDPQWPVYDYPPAVTWSVNDTAGGTLTTSEGSIEYKTAWIQYADASDCKSDTMICDGNFGLIGMSIAQKTMINGEWIWWSFEHKDAAPDCEPAVTVGDVSLPTTRQINTEGATWLLFGKTGEANRCDVPSGPNAAGTSTNGDFSNTTVTLTQACGGTAVPDIGAFCNQNPVLTGSAARTPADVCRTASLPEIMSDSATDTANAAEDATNLIIAGDSDFTSTNGGNNICQMSGLDDRQPAMVSCLNTQIADGTGLSFDPGVTDVIRKNYFLIGSTWTQDGVSVSPPSQASNQYAGASGHPIKGFGSLANVTMETWMQEGANTPSCEEDSTPTHLTNDAGCFGCHQALYKVDGSWVDYEHPVDGHVDFSHLLGRIVTPPAATE